MAQTEAVKNKLVRSCTEVLQDRSRTDRNGTRIKQQKPEVAQTEAELKYSV